MILAHTAGDGGPEIEFLILAGGMLVLAVIFFVQKTVKPQIPLLLALGAFALTAGAFAFSPDDGGSGASTDAQVVIVSPESGAVVPAEEPLTVEVRIEGGTLTEQNTSSDPNAGHLHIYIDGALISMPSVSDPEIPAENLTAGPHEILVEFTQADHRSFEPRVTATATVTAE